MVKKFFPFLLLVSGFCGISYEILYTKLLGNLLGNQFIINASVLLTFLLGIGLGTLLAHRFVRYLWAIEAGIGLYALLLTAVYPLIPVPGVRIAASALVAVGLLLVPAFLVGCSLPIFASYWGSLRETRVFSATYAVYNVGAAMTALAMEFVLLRTVGLRAATLFLALLNVSIAIVLLLWTRSGRLSPSRPTDRTRFPARVLAALVLASVASAIFQLSAIKIVEFVLGPFNETFSLVLATVLIGIALGSTAAGRIGLTFRGALVLVLCGLVWILAALPLVATGYAALYPHASDSHATLVLLKFGLVLVLTGAPAVGFGATIPALLLTHRDVARESGRLLFFSSMANALGFFLMAFVLHLYLDYGPILVATAVLAGASVLVFGGVRRPTAVAAVVLVLVAMLAGRALWDETFLYVGHRKFHSVAALEKEMSRRIYADRFKGPQDVFAIIHRDGRPYFFINGYISIPLSNASEKIVGALSSMLAPRTERALVLGVGSGATAGTVGLLFDRTDAVEINRAVLQNLYRMAEYNFDIEQRPGVSIIHDDGIRFVRNARERYDLILNTVSTPLYFSSSKLYTHDFFRLVREGLEPDGVYITWVDERIGDRGADIILESLRRTFDTCWLGYIKSNYFVLACSNGEIGLPQFEKVTANDELRDFFANEHGLPLTLLPYQFISTDALGLRSDDSVPLNTLDYPALEFEMTRLPAGSRFRQFKQALSAGIDLPRLEDTLSRYMSWTPREFELAADLRLVHDASLREILQGRIAGYPGLSDETYESVALALADAIGTIDGYYEMGVALGEAHRHEAAIEVLSRALALSPEEDNVNYFLGRSYYEEGRYDLALYHLEREWELDEDPDVPEWAGKTLMKLNRHDEAQRWLDLR